MIFSQYGRGKNNCELSNDDFITLFNKSSLLLNDSQSFVFLYHMWDKPNLFLAKENKDYNKYFSSYGEIALNLCYQVNNKKDLARFLDDLILNNLTGKKSELYKHFPVLNELSEPSIIIYEDILQMISE